MNLDKSILERTPEENREIQKLLASEWNEYTPEFRISATIHDGQWYTKEKWKKVAKLKKIEILDDWIEKNKDILIFHDNNNSFRVSYDEVIKWYKENNLDITKELVPKNYPPRLWNNKTETETFIDTPCEIVSSLLLKTNDFKIKEKIISLCQSYCQIKEDEMNRIYFYSLDADFLKRKIEKVLTEEELKRCELRTRFSFGKREIVDFDEEFLIESLKFYQVMLITLLKPHQKTMEIFLPEQMDRNAQMYEWIIKALQKYDENSGVPFSGYLASVLNRWPYDLPDNALGKPVAAFQRNRAKAIKKLKEFYKEEEISVDMIRKELNMYSDEQFKAYEEWNTHWLKIQGASNLNWEDKNVEKIGKNITYKKSNVDTALRSKITRAILNACVLTDNQISGIKLLNELHSTKIPDYNLITEELKLEIKNQLGKILNEERR